MKKLVFKCDVCGLEKTTEYYCSEIGNILIGDLVGISETDNRTGRFVPIRTFRELCPACRKQAEKELTEFLIDNRYFY